MPASPDEVCALEEFARQVRADIITEVHAAGSGHPGGSLSATDFATVLYRHFLRHRPLEPTWPERDRVFWSKGHCSPVVYAVLARCGYFSPELLPTFRKLGSPLQGHPARVKCPGVETNGGSLGQGLSVAVGFALGARMNGTGARSYAVLGDGEIQEGQIWEAAMSAAHYKLDSLVAVLDYNDLQIDGFVHNIMDVAPAAAKWEAFGWATREVNGHDIPALVEAFEWALAVEGKPAILIAHTVKGKGVTFMENQCEWHGQAPNDAQAAQALAEIGEVSR